MAAKKHDWLIYPDEIAEGLGSYQNEEQRPSNFGRRSSDPVLLDIARMMGQMQLAQTKQQETQDKQQQTLEKMSDIMMRFVAKEDTITVHTQKIEKMSEQIYELMQKHTALEQVVQNNKEHMQEHERHEVNSVKDMDAFIIKHARAIIGTLIAMIATAVVSKLPEIMLWFRGL